MSQRDFPGKLATTDNKLRRWRCGEGAGAGRSFVGRVNERVDLVMAIFRTGVGGGKRLAAVLASGVYRLRVDRKQMLVASYSDETRLAI